ncbi:MAG: hypothetical protein KIT58_05960 [Planctomycetota bacterium]|nr:hypothetical protein [Planctomycetota bacterium]
MWIESSNDYTPVPGDWIVARLHRLMTTLRERDPDFRALRPRVFLEPETVYAAVGRGDVDGAVRLVAEKYGLDPARVQLAWVPDIADQRVAAHVHCEQFGPIEVTMRAHYRSNARGFATIIAHELGHAYLTDMDIENGGGWEEEATTDLVTFVKGLGKLTVNGVDQVGPGQRAGSRCYGYLNREAVVFAYARTALEYGVGLEESRAGLSSAALGYLRVLEGGEPGLAARALDAVRRLFRRRKRITERNLVLDEHGNLVDADDPTWGRSS